MPAITPQQPSYWPALMTVSIWEPTITGAAPLFSSVSQTPNRFPIRSTTTAMPASPIQAAIRSRPALSSSEAARRVRRPSPSTPTAPRAPIRSIRRSLCMDSIARFLPFVSGPLPGPLYFSGFSKKSSKVPQPPPWQRTLTPTVRVPELQGTCSITASCQSTQPVRGMGAV